MTWFAVLVLFVSALQAPQTFPYLYLDFLDESGKALQPQDGAIRVGNNKRIHFYVNLRVKAVEDQYADLFIKARNQHPDTKRVQTVELIVKRVQDGRREDVPLRIYSSGGGKNLTVHYVSIEIDILAPPEQRSAEIRNLLELMEAEAAKQGAAGRFAALSQRKDPAIAMFDEMYVNNPVGLYEISAVYSARQAGSWIGRRESKPVRVVVEQRGDILDFFGAQKAKP